MKKTDTLTNNIQIRQRELELDFDDAEYITKQEQEYRSPIFDMSEDEVLAFVECFEAGELATLSVAELNHLGEVLGVERGILPT